MTSSPATTKVSLFASAMCLPAWMARMVGFNPAAPTIAVRTMSMPSVSTTCSNASAPL